MTEDEINRVHKAFYISPTGCAIWTYKRREIYIQGTYYAAWRVVWAALVGCRINAVKLDLVPGCGEVNCVEPNHRVPGNPKTIPSGWRYDFEKEQWKCKRGHYIEVVGQNTHGACRACARIRRWKGSEA